jgi:uncharacterized sporulation protein YeaH/YhbH (DUF444 family)
LIEMKRILDERFSPADWNIYAAQASDGDNESGDNARVSALLREGILPVCQHYAYLEVGKEAGSGAGFISRETSLWQGVCRIAHGGVQSRDEKGQSQAGDLSRLS